MVVLLFDYGVFNKGLFNVFSILFVYVILKFVLEDFLVWLEKGKEFK